MTQKILPALFIFLLLTSCGTSGQTETVEMESRYDWKANGFVSQSVQVNGSPNTSAGVSENLLFPVGYWPVEWSMPEQTDYRVNSVFRTSGSSFFVFDTFHTDQGTYSCTLQRINNQGNTSEILQLSSDTWGIPEGDIRTMDVLDEEHYVFWVTSKVEKTAEGNMEPEHYYGIYTDAQGKEQRRTDIIDLLREQGIWKHRGENYSYIESTINCDSKGNIYIRDWQNKTVYLLDPEGQLIVIYTYQSQRDNEIGVVRTEDGDVIIVCQLDGTKEFLWMDAERRDVKKLAVLDRFDVVHSWYGMWGNTLYYGTAGKQVIGWDVATGERRVLLNLKEYEIQDVFQTFFLKFPEGERLLVTENEPRYVLTLSYEEPQIEGALKVVNISEENAFLKGRVIAFSRENPLYGVEYVESYGEEDASRILMEMATGKGPAVAYVTRENLENLHANGALADLGSLLTEENLGALFPGAVAMGTCDSSLMGVPVTISSCQAIIVNNGFWPRTTWTIEDILGIMKEHPDIGLPLDTESSYWENMRMLLYYDLENSGFIQNGRGNFDSPEFRNLLEMVKKKSNGEHIPLYLSEARNWIKEGRYLGLSQTFFSLKSFCLDRETWDGRLHVTGYPSSGGSGIYLANSGLLVVNQNAADSEQVQRLVNYLLSLESQEKVEDQISVRRDAARLPVKYDSYGDRYVWVNNDGSRTILSGKIDDSFLEEYTQLLNAAIPIPVSSEELFDIIMEEADAYFEADKNLDDVCNAIQRRVQVYLDEQG